MDVWELRCRLNRSRYWERAETGEFAKFLDRQNPSRFGPPNTVSEQWYIRDLFTMEDMARISIFRHADGRAVTDPDPKMLYVNGVEFHLHPGELRNKTPSLRFPEGWMRKAYKWWRKRIKCPLLGR